MSRVCIFLNSPYLGGAERSMIIQSSMMESKCHFVIPRVKNDDGHEILTLIQKTSKQDYSFEYIDYPSALYEVSRSGTLTKYFSIIYSFALLYLEFRKMNLHSTDIIWVNGNKIGLPVLLYLTIKGFRNKLVWHFRDYPYNRGIFKVVWKLLKKDLSFKKVLVSNSESVTDSVKVICSSASNDYVTLYNPVGNLNIKKSVNRELKKIGVVSMFAPWKGLHTILEFEKINRDSLLKLGIEEILIYGADIYQTSGAHNSYANQLKKYLDNDSIVKFMGKRDVQEIYQNIDLLIHCSIDREPFGRVIVEGFASDTPVISTCLGGSAELVLHQKTGVRYFPYDHVGLLKEIEKLSNDINYRSSIVSEARNHLNQIEENQKKILNNLCLKP